MPCRCVATMALAARLWESSADSNQADGAAPLSVRDEILTMMDLDLGEFYEMLQSAARSVGAEVTSPWFYLQLGLMLAAAGIAFGVGALTLFFFASSLSSRLRKLRDEADNAMKCGMKRDMECSRNNALSGSGQPMCTCWPNTVNCFAR